MSDQIIAERRSANMAAIKNKDTKPEIYIRKLLYSNGYRYRKNVSNIAGKPDILLLKYNVAIFINGCFWHRHHGCKYAYMPKSRIDFWQSKFTNNIARDHKVSQLLRDLGIKQLVIWECSIKKMKKDDKYRQDVLDRIQIFAQGGEQYCEI